MYYFQHPFLKKKKKKKEKKKKMSHSSNYSQPSLKFPEKAIQTSDTNNETSTKFLPFGNNETTFSKELIKDFYNRIINTNSFDNFEDLSIEWIKTKLEHNDIDAETFLESIQD